jgi:hypothetical protein
MHHESYYQFAKEIEEVYATSGARESSTFGLGNHPDEIIISLRAMIETCVQDRGLPVAKWGESDDWFELGMDSLEATRLARMLSCVSDKDSFPALVSQHVQPSFIYQHPNFKTLSDCLLTNASSEEPNGGSSHTMIN